MQILGVILSMFSRGYLEIIDPERKGILVSD